jgi:hypothetical protein
MCRSRRWFAMAAGRRLMGSGLPRRPPTVPQTRPPTTFAREAGDIILRRARIDGVASESGWATRGPRPRVTLPSKPRSRDPADERRRNRRHTPRVRATSMAFRPRSPRQTIRRKVKIFFEATPRHAPLAASPAGYSGTSRHPHARPAPTRRGPERAGAVKLHRIDSATAPAEPMQSRPESRRAAPTLDAYDAEGACARSRVRHRESHGAAARHADGRRCC